MRAADAVIGAANGLTARWAAGIRAGTVFSGAGVWPLLALLADGAAGAARQELGAALGLPAGQAGAAGRELLAALEEIEGLESALGLWTARTVELREGWAAGLPAGLHGVLTGDAAADRGALDAWAERRTGGVIGRLPVPLRPDTSLLLVTALALRTDWETPFKGDLMPWREHDRAGLTRTRAGLDEVAVAHGPGGAVTVATVRGTNGLDVLLLLGEEEAAPGAVVGTGVEVVSGAVPAVPGSRLPVGPAGPGLRLERLRTVRPEPPALTLRTVEFALTAHHDLLARAESFGLATAADGTPGHFPGISAAPLGLASARQSATATFSAEGFRAAAVTLMEAEWLGWEDRPEPRHGTTRAHAVFDRPFGFLAVHRGTGLVLAAGWVDDPKRFPEDFPEGFPEDSPED
ncbi:serpin family protein [Streptomyces sp. NPDC006624]|uniref:serpin family protein n=1 Tax=Streptomyces sp. NPDC006624 TaxID=3154892 RepID=UPI0033B497FB